MSIESNLKSIAANTADQSNTMATMLGAVMAMNSSVQAILAVLTSAGIPPEAQPEPEAQSEAQPEQWSESQRDEMVAQKAEPLEINKIQPEPQPEPQPQPESRPPIDPKQVNVYLQQISANLPGGKPTIRKIMGDLGMTGGLGSASQDQMRDLVVEVDKQIASAQEPIF